MSVRGRLDRLARRVAARRPDAAPLTVFLVEAAAGTRVLWDGRAQEICYDPAAGPPRLPPGGPHKLILGPELDV